MNTATMTVKITTPDQVEQELTTSGSTLEDCVAQIHDYLDTTPKGTRVYMLDCNYTGESYEVTQ